MSNALDRMSRNELIARARRVGVQRPELLTRVELKDEIIRLTEKDEARRRRARGWLGVARDLLASAVEAGLNLPDAASVIRGEFRFDKDLTEQAPVATVTLAEIYSAQGHTERALTMLDEVLRKEPDHDVARTLRARLGKERAREQEQRSSSYPPSQPASEAKTPPSGSGPSGIATGGLAAQLEKAAARGAHAARHLDAGPLERSATPEAQLDEDEPQERADAERAAQTRYDEPHAGAEADAERAAEAGHEVPHAGSEADAERAAAELTPEPPTPSEPAPNTERAAQDLAQEPAAHAAMPAQAPEALEPEAEADAAPQVATPAPALEALEQTPAPPASELPSAAEARSLSELPTASELPRSPTLPPLGVDRIWVVAHSGGDFSVGWDLSDASLARLRMQKPDGWPSVKVVAMRPRWEGAERIERELPADRARGDAVVADLGATSVVRAALGWQSAEGFRPLAIATDVRDPEPAQAALGA